MNNATSTAGPQRSARRGAPRTLAVDIGGTGIKAELLDERGRPLSERARIATPKKATPRKVVAVVGKLAQACGGFDRVSVGFPGVVKNGIIYTAPNLGGGWNGYELQRELRRALKRPARIANDADVQGLGAVAGRGVELVITLGTGFGSVIFVDGHRIHLELGHHPFRKGRTYEEELGHRALKKKGKARWNRRLREAIEDLKQAFNYDRLFIGGGNSRYIRFEPPADVKIIGNEEGLLGGIRLWDEVPPRSAPVARLAGAPATKPAPSAKAVMTRAAKPAAAKPAAASASSAVSESGPTAKPVEAARTAAAAIAKMAAAKTATARSAVATGTRSAAAKIASAEAGATASKARVAASGERATAGAERSLSAAGSRAPAGPAAAANPAPGSATAQDGSNREHGEGGKGGGSGG